MASPSSPPQTQYRIPRVPVPSRPGLGSVLPPIQTTVPAGGIANTPTTTHGTPLQQSHSGAPVPIITHSTTTAQPQPLGQTITLSSRMEEDLKAAVLGAIPPPMPPPDEMTTERKWVLTKKWLRWPSFCICVFVALAEAILAILYGANLDTAYSIPWCSALGFWDTWRLIRLRRKRDVEPISVLHLVFEGLFMLITVILLILLATEVMHTRTLPWLVLYRGYGLEGILLILTILHVSLFVCACTEKYRKPRRSKASQKYQDTELPMYSHNHESPQIQQQPQIIVQYLHTCPHCGSHAMPQPGEDLNAELAKRGDLQPQLVAPPHLPRHEHT
ncbi:hypothetical protein F5B20DRAFT_95154 [Whalleya microplaca]|nr:hypothetical protein F5B20DRAFT_95154 [Whalleya microplaca]